MLIHIIAASRRIGDVIVCNKINLKIKEAVPVNILSQTCRSLSKDGKFLLNTSTQGRDREQQDTFLLKSNTEQSQVLTGNCASIVSTHQREKAGTKDTTVSSSTEKWLVKGNKVKLSKLAWRLPHPPKQFNRC